MKKAKKTVQETYQKKTPLQHILIRSDTYVGAIQPQTTKMWVLNQKDDIFDYKQITYTPGFYKIFDQILVNAADNYHRQKDMNRLDVKISPEESMISVENNGKGIPVQIHKDQQIYVPQMIFGHLLTGSNYDDEQQKVVGGRNGYGAKLANIFSTKFIVECGDNQRKKQFKMVWRNNMMNHDEAIINKFQNKSDYTKITFYPQLKRFSMEKFDEDTVALLSKRVYDMAGILPGVRVTLNGKKIECNTFDKYINMYLGVDNKTPKIKDKEVDNDRWKVVVTFSEEDFKQVSFVNSICTSKGGQHVNYIVDQIVKQVKARVKKKDKNLDPKPNLIKSHLWVFINCSIINPTFDSQTKENLTLKKDKFGSECIISEKMIKEITNSGIIDDIIRQAKAQDLRAFAKKAGGGKKVRLNGIAKLQDANKAGSKQSLKCTLILTQGDSAKGTAMSGLQVVGRDFYGVFPLKGKLLNVRQAATKKLFENLQITNIMKILGLDIKADISLDKKKISKKQNKKKGRGKSKSKSQQGSQISSIAQQQSGQQKEEQNSHQTIRKNRVIDTRSQQEILKKLRYGSLMIMTDQDTDGSHIKGLIINFIQTFWPQLFKRPGFLKQFITPILKVTKGQECIPFYTLQKYRSWMQGIENINLWKIKYYKGLGTSTDKQAKQYFQQIDRHMINFDYQNRQDEDCIELVFSKSKINQRKEWLSNYNPEAGMNYDQDKIRYKDFIDNEFIHFSNYDNIRSICNVMDGLKPGQRKILFSCFKRNLTKQIKVAQLSGYVAQNSAYHHGQMSLGEAIVGMAQNFAGSNNINLLMPNGQYGSRMCGGKSHASPRYIFTALNRITRYIFPQPDDHSLKYVQDDGQLVQPQFYVPIIPLSLINGCSGIGTGWSTFIPNFNPRQLVQMLLDKLRQDKQFSTLLPWYKNYTGRIQQVNSKNVSCSGYVQLDMDNCIVHIKQLPIGKWTNQYKEFLDKRVENKDYNDQIQSFNEYHTKSKVHFQIFMNQEFFNRKGQNYQYWEQYFKLKGNISLNNMVAFNHESKIVKYNTMIEVLNQFYEIRCIFYQKRKQYMLSKLQRDCVILQMKQKFIREFIQDKIQLKKVKKIKIVQQLKKRGYIRQKDLPKVKSTKSHKLPKREKIKDAAEDQQQEDQSQKEVQQESNVRDYDYLLGMPIYSLTEEKVQQLKRQLSDKQKEFKRLSKIQVKDMWIQDLNVFLKVLDQIEQKQQKQRIAQQKKGNKNKPKKGQGKPRAKKPKKVVEDSDSNVTDIQKPKKGGKGGAKSKKKQQDQKEQKIKKRQTNKSKGKSKGKKDETSQQQKDQDSFMSRLHKKMEKKKQQKRQGKTQQVGYVAVQNKNSKNQDDFQMVKKKKKMQLSDSDQQGQNEIQYGQSESQEDYIDQVQDDD